MSRAVSKDEVAGFRLIFTVLGDGRSGLDIETGGTET